MSLVGVLWQLKAGVGLGPSDVLVEQRQESGKDGRRSDERIVSRCNRLKVAIGLGALPRRRTQPVFAEFEPLCPLLAKGEVGRRPPRTGEGREAEPGEATSPSYVDPV